MIEASPESALCDLAQWLSARRVAYALVGGLAVSVRGEVRFTRDVDVALAVSDSELESLVRDLRAAGYGIVALVEHEIAGRTATVRLRSRSGITIDVLAASSGIEAEIVAAAQVVDVPDVGAIPVATAEDLLAMKILSMTSTRAQDRIDAVNLVAMNPTLDRALVRARLELIRSRGFDREQDLVAKLAEVIEAAGFVTRAFVFVLFVTSVGCRQETLCECRQDVVGLVVHTGAPVTRVSLGGTACTAGHFRCVPAEFDDTIHPSCDEVQIAAALVGVCRVELLVSGKPIVVERDMTDRGSGCCGGFIGEAKFEGDIDLRGDGRLADAAGDGG